MISQSGPLLVVDDDDLNRDMLSRRLRRKGFEVEVAADGEEALAKLRDRRISLVLLDVMMPGLVNGLDVLEILRRDRPPTDLPIIMATARDQSEDIVHALELGANDYVTKPLDFPVVLARIRTHLALKQAIDSVVELERSLEERNRKLEAANVRMTRDLKAAAHVQAAFLPRRTPIIEGASFGWVFRPCEELAGDGLNIIPFDGRRVGLYVMDVSGHGVASALLSVAVARMLTPPGDPASILSADGREPLPPDEVAAELDRRFPFDHSTEQFFTFLYGILDVPTGEFRFISAGHPGPIRLSSSGEASRVEVRGLPIGLSSAPHEVHRLELAPGDRLVLYSDGVPEAVGADGTGFGEDRMLDALTRCRDRNLSECLDALRSDLELWCGEQGPRDDISLLAVGLAADAAPVRP